MGEAGCDTSWSSAQTKKPAECAFTSKRTSLPCLADFSCSQYSKSCLCFKISKDFLFSPQVRSSAPWNHLHNLLLVHVMLWKGVTPLSTCLPKQGRRSRGRTGWAGVKWRGHHPVYLCSKLSRFLRFDRPELFDRKKKGDRFFPQTYLFKLSSTLSMGGTQMIYT